ncbi:MAG: hypothetical protein KAG99_08355 [Bacteroidales bacterium]|nr:hypothetical protein [Bacteroidales bacterium]
MNTIIKICLLAVIVAFVAPSQSLAQGCVEGGSDEGVNVVGYVQPEWNYHFDGVDKNGDAIDNESSFYFRRARIGVVGSIPYDISYYVMAEFSPMLGGPYLLDAFVSYTRLGPYAKISMGQFKSPYSMELNTPCHALHTIFRSRVVSELATPFRDIGMMVSGGTADLPIFGLENENLISYQFAILNGTGMNEWDNNTNKDVVGRLVFAPVKYLKIGGSFRYGKQKPAKPDMDDDTRTRYGAELEIKVKDFLLQAEYLYGMDKGSSLVGGGCGGEPTVVLGDFEKSGYYVQAMYLTSIGLQPVLKYEWYDPDMDKNNNAAYTTTIGLNYFLNDWSRIQANYMINENKDITSNFYQSKFLIQVQAKF